MQNPTEIYKAWLAGFFDGEGCITLYCNPGTELKVPRVGIGQKNAFELLTEIQQVYGGGVNIHKGKGMFRWFCSSRTEIQRFLTDILPYLKVKRAKAEIALAICEVMTAYKRTDREKLMRYHLEEKFESLQKSEVQ